MASEAIARMMISKIDEMQALTEGARGSIEKQLTDLRDAMVAEVGAEPVTEAGTTTPEVEPEIITFNPLVAHVPP